MKNFCSRCGTPLQEGARFCSGCGKPVIVVKQPETAQPQLKRVCPNCGGELRPQSRFCKKCGMQLAGSQLNAPQPIKQPQNKKNVSFTGLRIVLGIICIGLITVGVIFIPSNISERTKGENVGTQQSITGNSTSNTESETDGEISDVRENSEIMNEYKRIDKANAAGEYSDSEEAKQRKKDAAATHDMMNGWLYDNTEKSEVFEE